MHNDLNRMLLRLLMSAVVVGTPCVTSAADNAKLTEAEAKMFAASGAYERFMGRWSRRLAPAYIGFVGVSQGTACLT